MTRSHGWFVLALTAACSSQSASDDMAAVTSDPSSVTSQPSDTGSTSAAGGAPVTVGMATDEPSSGQTTNAPATGPRPPVIPPSPMPQPTPSMAAADPTETGAGGDPPTEMTATGGSGGAEGPSSGGEVGMGGSTPMGGTGGTAAGGAPMEEVGGGGAMTSGGAAGAPMEGGECTVGTTSGNEVVIIGESFIAASSIPQELAELAIANGSLQQGESYINNSVSGTRLGDGAIPGQYTRAAQSNSIRFVLMDGGGNDCLQANDSNSPISAAEGLFEEMAADGVEKVVYFFYPDPAGAFGGGGSSLKTCLDELRPKMKAVCDGLTAPKCYWLDLRETSWTGNESNYTSDGIHPNAEGSRVTAEAIWEVMVENCVAQ